MIIGTVEEIVTRKNDFRNVIQMVNTICLRCVRN